MDPEQEMNKENSNKTEKEQLKPKRRNSTEARSDFIPLKSMKLMDFRNVTNRMTKVLAPFSFGYDGKMKTIKRSKIGNRRISQWDVRSLVQNNSETHTVVDAVQLELGDKNKSQQVDQQRFTTELTSDMEPNDFAMDADRNLNDVIPTICAPAELISDANTSRSEPTEEVGLIVLGNKNKGERGCDETISEALLKAADKSLSEAASIMFRRRSARLSQSLDNMGSFFLVTNPSKNVEHPNQSKPSELKSKMDKSRSNKPLQENCNKMVTQVQTEANENRNRADLPQNIREVVSKLLTKPQNDDVKLWQTRKNSISDPLFYCFDLVEHINANTIKVTCLLCDPTKEPLTCKVGSNSNLKTHLNRVSSILSILSQNKCVTEN